MAGPVGDRNWRTSTPATIEQDLSELWRDVGSKGPIARAMMSNLVIVRAARIERRAGVSIDDVVAQHPSRVLIIDHDVSGTCGEITAARVGVITFGPPESRYGVEQIAVRSAFTDESLPSLVRRLVRGDLPMSVWWAEDVSEAPLIGSILEMGRQFVYDSRQWYDVQRGVFAVESWGHLDLVDVNWRRLSAIRRGIILAAAGTGPEDWSPDAVRVTHAWADRAMAWLLVGWLASILDWPSRQMPVMEEATDGTTVLSVSIGKGAEPIIVRSDGRQVFVQHPGRPPAFVGIPTEGDAEAVAAELHSLSHDVRLHETLKALQRHFTAA